MGFTGASFHPEIRGWIFGCFGPTWDAYAGGLETALLDAPRNKKQSCGARVLGSSVRYELWGSNRGNQSGATTPKKFDWFIPDPQFFGVFTYIYPQNYPKYSEYLGMAQCLLREKLLCFFCFLAVWAWKLKMRDVFQGKKKRPLPGTPEGQPFINGWFQLDHFKSLHS